MVALAREKKKAPLQEFREDMKTKSEELASQAMSLCKYNKMHASFALKAAIAIVYADGKDDVDEHPDNTLAKAGG